MKRMQIRRLRVQFWVFTDFFSSYVQWKSDSQWKRKSEEWKPFQKLKFNSWGFQAIKKAGKLWAHSTHFEFFSFLLFVSVRGQSCHPCIWLLYHRYIMLTDFFYSILIKLSGGNPLRLIENSCYVHHRGWFNSESPEANFTPCAVKRESCDVETVLLLKLPVLEGKPCLPRPLETCEWRWTVYIRLVRKNGA